ncbi:hypothetical protein F4776DRAFT_567019 [Hypoxylon sp. NC0597]|nr:hypothetical protein F4776DRAFT_567019 [Hypoxylon sp. NC0597]
MSSQVQSDTSESDQVKQAPPAYNELDANMQSVRRTIPQPGTISKIYFEDEREPNIVLYLSPESERSYTSQKWFAQLHFKCENVPQLMREGLYWTTDNVAWEDGFVGETSKTCRHHYTPELLQKIKNSGFWWTRHYFLRDIQHKPPRWIAHFQFHSATTHILTEIRLGDISVENVFNALAMTNDTNLIYLYGRHDPAGAFNAIYDDMPMDGWWPWPKEDEEP